MHRGWSLTKRCQWHRGVSIIYRNLKIADNYLQKLEPLHKTCFIPRILGAIEWKACTKQWECSAVSMTPWSWTSRCQWHCLVFLQISAKLRLFSKILKHLKKDYKMGMYHEKRGSNISWHGSFNKYTCIYPKCWEKTHCILRWFMQFQEKIMIRFLGRRATSVD